MKRAGEHSTMISFRRLITFPQRGAMPTQTACGLASYIFFSISASYTSHLEEQSCKASERFAVEIFQPAQHHTLLSSFVWRQVLTTVAVDLNVCAKPTPRGLLMVSRIRLQQRDN
jgi:hypothetical protein